MAQQPASNSVPIRIVFGVGAALAAAFGTNAFWPWLGNVGDYFTGPEKRFEAAYVTMLDTLKIKPPDFDSARRSVGVAYDLAVKPTWKCRVVNVVIDSGDATVTVRITPIGVYEDYKHARLPQQCADQLNALAKLIEQQPNFSPYVGAATADDARNTQLRTVAENIVAQGTPNGTKGWVYLGRSDASGQLTAARSVVETRPSGSVTITHDLTLSSAPPKTADGDAGPPVGRVLAGSKLRVISVRPLAEAVKTGPAGSYTWALVALEAKGKPQSVASATYTRRTLTRAVATQLVALADAVRCPLIHETNSLHASTQRWIYVGQKRDGSEEFEPKTSRLDTPCVPRDGAIARVTQTAKVLVGVDPHWPGVKANGQALVAGTNVQIVGDVSGYGFDATADPSFCDRDPKPRKTDAPTPAGHEKRYCVYIPFSPI